MLHIQLSFKKQLKSHTRILKTFNIVSQLYDIQYTDLAQKKKSKCLVDCIMYNTQILNRKRNQNVQYTDTEQKKK